MDIQEKMEMTRNILNDAIEEKASKETILKISQKLDEYIVKYLDSKTQFSKPFWYKNMSSKSR